MEVPQSGFTRLGRSGSRRLVLWAIGLLSLLCLAALPLSPASAATHVYYGDAVFSPYQGPAQTTNNSLNFTRMSTQHPREVRAGVTYIGGGYITWTDPDYFVQNPTSLNAPLVQGAYCQNYSSVNVYGYCAWYN